MILRNSDTGAAWSDVPMLLDSGADVQTLQDTLQGESHVHRS